MIQHSSTQKYAVWAAIALLVLSGILLPRLTLAQESAGAAACTQDARVQSNDTLSGLAQRYLGSLTAYRQIIDATNAAAARDASYATIDDPNVLEVGWKLCIPARSAASTSPLAAPLAGALVTPATPLTTRPAPTSTPIPEARHPLRIDVMRQAVYPGSDITIEQVLEPGVNYNRYLASYLSDGLKIYALLTVPRGVRPASGWPVVVFNHGYIPPEVYRTTERYVAYVDAFARNGYIVFRSDYRGHGFSEGDAPGGYGSPAYTVDVLNAVAAIKSYPDADPNRIGMWGHSMGGSITLRSMVVSEDIRAGVIWAGVVAPYPDLIERWRTLLGRSPSSIPNRWRRWREELVTWYGSPAENPAFWAEISPNSYLADLSGPIQLHHGTVDSSVPVEFSQELYAALQAAEMASELYVYPGDDHNISANLGVALERSVAFFDAHVKNIDAP
jgi:fermentation-respiration switch protein FrsA (DUF1100 family)